MRCWALVATLAAVAVWLSGCSSSPGVRIYETDQLPISRSAPAPAPAWCQSPRDTWNGFGCSIR